MFEIRRYEPGMKAEWDVCEKLCKEIIAKEPAFAPAWNNLALAQFEQGNYAAARESVKEAQRLGFDVPEGFLEELAQKGA